MLPGEIGLEAPADLITAGVREVFLPLMNGLEE
jgi:hypothetical protein